jgi:DNA polymerase elongation subunit (family B)
VVVEHAPFAPFLLLADRALVAGADGLQDVEALEGGGALRWLARFASWRDAVAADARCRARSAPGPPGSAVAHRFLADPVDQYLLWSGRTSFGDMVFGDLRRLALDLEVVTTDGFEFPSAARTGDRIVAIALADSHGFREVLRGDRMDERALIEACGALVRERDPDVIEGHNLFRFDLPYLEARARMHGVPLAWGRDGSVIRGRPARLHVAERSIVYRRHQVSGRHVVDTWMLAQLHDVGARDLPSFGLKDVARHLGVAAPGRTYVDGGAITREFAEQPDRLMAYALDDVVETLSVGAILAPPYFVQAQVVPFDYQSTVLRGAAAKIDRLLLREYLHRRRAVPLPAAAAPVSGALVVLLRQGVARPALHVDVTSLYPSVMLARGIAPASDELAVFGELLARLREFRVEAKRRASSSADPAEQAHHRALQQSFKILINAFYGYLAFGSGHWNDFHAADRVTSHGREVVAAIIEGLERLQAVPVEADTDGVYFVPPPGHRPADDEALLARVAAALPAGIHLELDGRYAAMLSYKLKTYALLDERGRLLLKGSAFRSRGLEPFQRQLIEEIVRLLVTGRTGDVKAVVDRWLADFAARRVPPRLFARTETLGESPEAYRARVVAGERPASAAHELALASGREWQAGDQVSYYVAGRGAGVTVADHARLLSAWDPARPDENVEYYQAKVWEVWTRFRRFTEREGLWTPVEEAEAPAQLTLF